MLLGPSSRCILACGLQARTNRVLHKTIAIALKVFWTIVDFAARYAYLDRSLRILTLAGQDPDTKEGNFEHPIIQDVLNSSLFKNRRSHGVIYRQAFTSKLPLVTIALILTAVCTKYIYIYIFCIIE
jgi:predicted membrane protein